MENPKNHSPHPDDYHARKIAEAVNDVREAVERMTSGEAVNSEQAETQDKPSTWEPINEAMRAWIEEVHWAILDYEEGKAEDCEEAVATAAGVYAADDKGELWEFAGCPSKRDPQYWELELTRQEIAGVAEERITRLRLTPCRHPDCRTLVRRRVPYCSQHEPHGTGESGGPDEGR